MKTINNLLKELKACKEAVLWAKDKSWEEIYNTCHRGDWLLWLFSNTNPNNIKELVLAKGYCANIVRHLMKDKRSIKDVDAAIAFGEGKIDEKELFDTAYIDAYVDVYADAYAYAYANTNANANADADANAYVNAYVNADAYANTYADAYADAYAYAYAYAYTNAYTNAYIYANVYNYADADVYANAYANAYVYADTDADGYAYADACIIAKVENQKLTADICRKYLPIEIWNIKFD